MRHSSSSSADIPQEQTVIFEMLTLIAEHTKKHGTRIQGQCAIEIPKRVPVVAMYASYPSGDYLCWFNDGADFKMYALVNEKFQTVLNVPNTQMDELQAALTEIQKEMDRANPPSET